MKIEDLYTLEEDIKKVLFDYIKENDMTISGLANEIGIHPYQLLRFMNRGKGINLCTITKIGAYARNL